MRLGAFAEACGFRHEHRDIVGSTNVEVLEDGRDRMWVTAGEQVSGRGRRGRDWVSPRGNVYASLLLLAPAERERAPDVCFVAALAVSDAVFAVAPRAAADLALKWPNDVLIGGAKTSGILVEGVQRAETLAVVIGCGINIVSHPEGTPYPVTHLRRHDAEIDAEGFFLALSDAFAHRLGQWQRGAGFSTIRRDWLARAAGIGRRIVVRLPASELDGTFESLDEEGALILRTDDGTRRAISAGEIFFAGQLAGLGVN